MKSIVAETECEIDNQAPSKNKSKTVAFVKKGQKVKGQKSEAQKSRNAAVFGAGDDWVVNSDLETRLVIPKDLADTAKRPDLVMISRRIRRVILCQLTCPWEENAEWALGA